MSPYQDRVISEREELQTKLTALQAFIKDNPMYSRLPLADSVLLCEQAIAMQRYVEILQLRIARFQSA